MAAIVAVLGFASCEKDNANSIIGTWEATSIHINIEGIEMTVDIKEMAEGTIEMNFQKDGTATLTEIVDGESYSETCDYTYTDNILTLSQEGESISIPATISGN